MPTLAELAALTGGKVEGPATLPLDGIAPVADATERQITFITNDRFIPLLEKSRAGAVLIGPGRNAQGKPALVVPNPGVALIVLLNRFAPVAPAPAAGIHPSATVDKSAKLGNGVVVGAGAVVEAEVELGEGTRVGALCHIGWKVRAGKNCRFDPMVSIHERTEIGNNVVIFSGTVIGADGFGYVPGPQGVVKIPQIGRVVIEDDVEIGANSCVDRAMAGVTLIKRGVKIDNQVQIAHNDVIGENVVIAGQCGLAGSITVGRNAIIGGKVGIVDHVDIGEGAIIAALSGVHNNVPAHMTVYGYPAREAKEGLKLYAELARLPHLVKRVRAMEARLAELEKKAKGPDGG